LAISTNDGAGGTDSDSIAITVTSQFLTSLVAYWKLEDVNDSHTNGLTLTNNNSVTFTSGKVNNAATVVAASSQYLSLADTALLRPGNFDYTWACWFKLTTTAGTQTIISKDFDTTRGWQLVNGAGTLTWNNYRNNATGIDITDSVSAGTWYLFIGWHDAAGDTINMKLNNGTTTSIATSGNFPQASTAPFAIGRNSYPGFSQYMGGQVDEVAYWTRVLTAGEMTRLYNSGNGRTYPAF
jgi:hypothetical protein